MTTSDELRERLAKRCRDEASGYDPASPEALPTQEVKWWLSAIASELGITREMVEQCNRAIMYVKSPDTETAADVLTTLLDAAEGR